MEISLPESVQRVLQAKADEGHYDTLEEYVAPFCREKRSKIPRPPTMNWIVSTTTCVVWVSSVLPVRPRLRERTTSRLNRSR